MKASTRLTFPSPRHEPSTVVVGSDSVSVKYSTMLLSELALTSSKHSTNTLYYFKSPTINALLAITDALKTATFACKVEISFLATRISSDRFSTLIVAYSGFTLRVK